MANIPKIIHYCWFGPNELSQLAKDCIATWKRVLPDYQLRLWSNDDWDLIAQNRYAKEAFESKKFAFVTDYIRLYAIHKYGGVYMDTDVECRKSLDEFLHLDFFSSYEDYHSGISPITAVMASKAGNLIARDLLQPYADRRFINDDGSFDLTPNTAVITSYFAEKFGLRPPYDPKVSFALSPTEIIYPANYFCKDEGAVTYSVHHFSNSWIPAGRKRRDKIARAIRAVIGERLYRALILLKDNLKHPFSGRKA